MRKVFYFLFLAGAFLSVSALPLAAETYIGKLPPTGLLELEDLKDPVFVFVPEHYEGRIPFGLIVALTGEGEVDEKQVQRWTGIAKRKNYIVLLPSVGFRKEEGDVPFQTDVWLLKLLEDVRARYRVDPGRVFLVGEGGGAHYASYLAVNYPDRFSAAALLGGSWIGPFEPLMRPKSRPAEQVPFFVSFETIGTEALAETEKRAERFSGLGYPVHLEKLEDKDEKFDSLGFQQRLLAWLAEKSQSWALVTEEHEKTFREKFRLWLDRNIQVT